MSLLVLTAADVDLVTPHFTPNELMSLMARVFHLISSESTQSPSTYTYTPHRTSIPMPHHTALFMPARIAHPSLPGTTIKVVCVPRTPGDTRGLPASTLVMDEATGAVQAVVNARKLTALRNAAGSLLSTTLAGIHTPTSIVAFGAGQQILSHLTLHLRFFPSSLKSCTIINRTLNSRVDALRTSLTHQFPHVAFHFLASSPTTGEETHGEKNEKNDKNQTNPIRTALLSTSLIICATSSTTPLFPSHWVRTGTHVILIGSYTPAMREVDCALVRRALGAKPSGSSPQQSKSSSPQQSKSSSPQQSEPSDSSPHEPNHPKPTSKPQPLLIVDSRTACAIEAGELIDAGVSGDEVVEIGELVRLKLPRDDGGEFDFDFDLDFGLEVGEGGESDVSGGSESDGSGEVEVGGNEGEGGNEDGEGPITIFKSVGVGLQDVAIACAVVRKAREMGVGAVVPGYD